MWVVESSLELAFFIGGLHGSKLYPRFVKNEVPHRQSIIEVGRLPYINQNPRESGTRQSK